MTDPKEPYFTGVIEYNIDRTVATARFTRLHDNRLFVIRASVVKGKTKFIQGIDDNGDPILADGAEWVMYPDSEEPFDPPLPPP